jgi:hypothetical protein
MNLRRELNANCIQAMPDLDQLPGATCYKTYYGNGQNGQFPVKSRLEGTESNRILSDLKKIFQIPINFSDWDLQLE